MAELQRVLVTGGGGFIGSHVAEYYASSGVDVTVLDNLSRTEMLDDASTSEEIRQYNWAYLDEQYPEVELVQGDVRDAELVADLAEGQDGIVHTAGQVAVTASLMDPRADFETNALGTFNVLEGARTAENDPAVVFASTNKVYGDNVNEIPVEEGDTRFRYSDPSFADGIPETLSIDGCEHTPYGVSKLAADLYVQDYATRGVIDGASFRMSCIYGTRQFGNEDQGWIAHFVLSALRGDDITIFGNGKQVRDALFVEDLVEAYDAYLREPAGKPSVFNIGGGAEHTTSLLELLGMLEEEFDLDPAYSFDDWREGDQKVYVSDIGRAKSALDWQPTVGLREGIGEMIRWYEKTFEVFDRER